MIAKTSFHHLHLPGAVLLNIKKQHTIIHLSTVRLLAWNTTPYRILSSKYHNDYYEK